MFSAQLDDNKEFYQIPPNKPKQPSQDRQPLHLIR